MSEALNLTLKLTKPVSMDGQEFTELTLRELTVDEIIAHEKSHGQKVVPENDKFFYALSCGVPPELIGKLGSRDWQRLKHLHWATLGNVGLESEPAE